jgi:hypothetical protein
MYPAVILVTFTVMAHPLVGPNAKPVYDSVLDPGTAVIAPPGHVVVKALGVPTADLAGNVSVN